MNLKLRTLLSEYSKKEIKIKNRLKHFRSIWNQPDKKIFSELCFCICTPQSKAVTSDKAISHLEKTGDLFKGSVVKIRAGLEGVRFPNNKSNYILKARKLFTAKGAIKIKNKINRDNVFETREWFVKNVTGIGFKEASHFLRNIGFGQDLAILDVHILKNMLRYKVIKEIPKSISRTKYLFLENKFKKFAEKIKIPVGELDLLFWSAETGDIFK